MDDEQASGGDSPDQAVPLELLADLQAGLLDDAAAAQLRKRIRDDPAVARRYAELEQVRRDLHDLADDPAESDLPPEVAARIGAALRSGSTQRPAHQVIPPTHAARHGARRPHPAAIAGAAAGLLAIGIGGTILVTSSDRPAPMAVGPTVASLTVQRQAGMPWPDRQILGLLSRPPELGALAGPDRLRSCLQGLGYSPATQVLGASTLTAPDRAEVMLLLPGADHGSLMALVVSPGCSATDAGLVADAVIPDPPAAAPRPSR